VWVPEDRAAQLPSRRVEADLRRRLDHGEWDHGQALPSVAELSRDYAVARNTVVKALRKLEADGLIEIVPSWGTFRK
jgi:DNA-binding GntR family transcriptional regulator